MTVDIYMKSKSRAFLQSKGLLEKMTVARRNNAGQASQLEVRLWLHTLMLRLSQTISINGYACACCAYPDF